MPMYIKEVHKFSSICMYMDMYSTYMCLCICNVFMKKDHVPLTFDCWQQRFKT